MASANQLPARGRAPADARRYSPRAISENTAGGASPSPFGVRGDLRREASTSPEEVHLRRAEGSPPLSPTSERRVWQSGSLTLRYTETQGGSHASHPGVPGSSPTVLPLRPLDAGREDMDMTTGIAGAVVRRIRKSKVARRALANVDRRIEEFKAQVRRGRS